MNKVVLKELKKEHIWIRIIFYGLFTLVGLELLHFSDLGFKDPIHFISMIFYSFAFLTLFTYFVNRVQGNYELLYFGLINVLTGTFVLVNVYYPNSGFILADAVLLYSIANVLNSGCTCYKMFKEKNISFFMKAAITIMLLFLGVFVVSALYDKVEFGTLILGYYFSAFGLLHLLEIFTTIVLGDKKTQKLLLNYISFEEVKEMDEKKTPIGNVNQTSKKVVKDRTIKKIKRK